MSESNYKYLVTDLFRYEVVKRCKKKVQGPLQTYFSFMFKIFTQNGKTVTQLGLYIILLKI